MRGGGEHAAVAGAGPSPLPGCALGPLPIARAAAGFISHRHQEPEYKEKQIRSCQLFAFNNEQV